MNGTTPGTIECHAWLQARSCERDHSLGIVARALAVGLAISALQVGVCLTISLAAGNGSLQEAYRAFCRRDGFMYAAILKDGYRSTIPPTASVNFDDSNVAFFPGYPLAGRLVYRLARGSLSPHTSLVVTAQLAAWGFWTYWLLTLARLGVDRRNTLLLTSIAALHPAAFFLVVAYSESLFMLGLLGFFYWITSRTATQRWWAVPHGLLMTATRLGGLPLAWLPWVTQLVVERAPRGAAIEHVKTWRRGAAQLALIGTLASLGGVAFFAFCQGRFGAWDLYFQTQREGQGVGADWLWLARPASYAFVGSAFHRHLDWTDDLSRFAVGLTVVLFAVIGRREWRLARAGDDGWRKRLLFYLCAAELLFIHAAGVSPRHMQSMLRYCYPVHVLLLVALAQWAASSSNDLLERWTARRVTVALLAVAVLQLILTCRYFQGGWVA